MGRQEQKDEIITAHISGNSEEVLRSESSRQSGSLVEGEEYGLKNSGSIQYRIIQPPNPTEFPAKPTTREQSGGGTNDSHSSEHRLQIQHNIINMCDSELNAILEGYFAPTTTTQPDVPKNPTGDSHTGTSDTVLVAPRPQYTVPPPWGSPGFGMGRKSHQNNPTGKEHLRAVPTTAQKHNTTPQQSQKLDELSSTCDDNDNLGSNMSLSRELGTSTQRHPDPEPATEAVKRKRKSITPPIPRHASLRTKISDVNKNNQTTLLHPRNSSTVAVRDVRAHTNVLRSQQEPPEPMLNEEVCRLAPLRRSSSRRYAYATVANRLAENLFPDDNTTLHLIHIQLNCAMRAAASRTLRTIMSNESEGIVADLDSDHEALIDELYPRLTVQDPGEQHMNLLLRGAARTALTEWLKYRSVGESVLKHSSTK